MDFSHVYVKPLRHSLALAAELRRRCLTNKERVKRVAESLDLDTPQVLGALRILRLGEFSPERLALVAMRDYGLDDADIAEMWGRSERWARLVRENAEEIRAAEPIPEELEYLDAGLYPGDPSPEDVATRCGLEVDKVLELMQYAIPTVSLDTPLGDDGDGGAYGDIIADANAESPITVAERNALIGAVQSELHLLPERDREILIMRFGLEDGRPRTLDEVANAFGVTRERIRQIEQKTLARLRHPHNSARLRGFLDD